MAGITDNIQMEWITDHRPTEKEIAEEQDKRGFCPTGYGSPFHIKTERLVHTADYTGDQNYKTTWYCFASCD